MIPQNLALLLPDWDSLDSVRKAHSFLELWAIWLFAALVVCDVVAHLIEDSRKPLAKIFERIGLCCFALAVAAELSAYKYGQRNDALSDQKIRSLDAVAHDADSTAKGAKTTADGAKAEADAVSVKADALDRQLAAAETRVTTLKTRVAARKDLLIDAEPELVKKLSKLEFKGQVAVISLCPGSETITGESGEIEDAGRELASILNDGAHWKADLPSYRGQLYFLPLNCTRGSMLFPIPYAKRWGGGIMVLVSSKASQSTTDAANALSAALSAVLPSTSEKPEVINPDTANRLGDPELREPIRDLVAHGNTIAIMIGWKPQPP